MHTFFNIVTIFFIALIAQSLYLSIKDYYINKKYNYKIKGVITDVKEINDNICLIIKWYVPENIEYIEGTVPLNIQYYQHIIEKNKKFKNDDIGKEHINKLIVKYVGQNYYLHAIQNQNNLIAIKSWSTEKFAICYKSILLGLIILIKLL